MSLQKDNLAMVALGVLSNSPVNPAVNPFQAPLERGIHLRWGFLRELGFPWHGFYLFRRPARPGKLLCLGAVTGGLKKGVWPDTKYYSAIGLVSSNSNLVLTQDFSTGISNQIEFALDGRDYLRFDLPTGELARLVELRIGFRSQGCLDFQKLIPPPVAPANEVSRPNPLNLQGASITMKNSDGKLPPSTQFETVNTTEGPITGLKCLFAMTIKLSDASDNVELLLSLIPDFGVRVEGFDSEGKLVATAQMLNPQNERKTVTLNGKKIIRLEVRTNGLHLYRICVDKLGSGPAKVVSNAESVDQAKLVSEAEVASQKTQVKVTAFSGAAPVRSFTITGQAGQVQSVTLEADAISAVEIGPGPGSLVILCYVPVAQEATEGWEKLTAVRTVEDFLPAPTYPIGLPVSQPDYPCSVANPQSLVTDRVHYQLPPEWDGSTFNELHDQLVKLVEGGPVSAPMVDRIFTSPEDSNPPEIDPPKLSKFYILDMVLLGALHPALAQLVGLYWVDQTAKANEAYDYLIVADHTGVGQRDGDQVLAVIETKGFAELDGYIVFNQSRLNAPPLPAPKGLETFELPGGFFPDAQGDLPQAANNAGLRWKVGEDDPDGLLPESAVMYLVWRDGLGDEATPAPAGVHDLITKVPTDKPKPLLVTEARLPRGLVPQRSPEWPAVPHFIDRNRPDGWYSYQVSGMDLFGRHSPNSVPSQLLLRYNMPPPMPTAVEAYALDPEDPFLQKDVAYNNWVSSLSPASLQQTLVGLRVRWKWTLAHQQQAPDTTEFRIYFQPGAKLPDDHDLALNWHERFYVVGYNDNVTTDSVSGERAYEVFLPPATAPNSISIPLNPSLAVPVAYAYIGVSAADDKPHTADQRTTGNFSSRPGNEGPVGPAARIYRVWRGKPAPPAALEDTERVFASPADYHDRSFYTYRWQPPNQADNLRLHLFRAMDDAIIKTDWFIRTTRISADPGNPQHQRFFPTLWNQDLSRQQAAANALNAITSPADYNNLSNDALELLACLPGNDGVEDLNELKQRDWAIRQSRQNLSDSDLIDFSWDQTKRQNVAGELNRVVLSGAATTAAGNKITLDGTADLGRVRPQRDSILLIRDTKNPNREYRITAVDVNARTVTLDEPPVLAGGASAWAIPLYKTLSDNGMRALAILPGNDAAFLQVTLNPLDSYESDPADITKLRWRDRRGPDNADDFLLHSDPNMRRAYVDTLDGRSTTRYFYRAAFVDGAHNLGELGLVGPAVYLPNVVPPRAPVITKVLGGDRQITIKWASNREPDLADYRLYRTDKEEATRDVRLMTLLETPVLEPTEPADRSAEVTWIDAPVPGRLTFYYRLVAVDNAGNSSVPSPVVAGRAYKISPPAPPDWEIVKWIDVNSGRAVFLKWNSTEPGLLSTLQRRAAAEGAWQTVSPQLAPTILPGTWEFTDDTATVGVPFEYRIFAEDEAGNTSVDFNPFLLGVSLF